MRTIGEYADQDIEEGLIAVTYRVSDNTYGQALEVFPYEESGMGYNYSWGTISSATIFDPKVIKTLDDIDRVYGINTMGHNQRNGLILVKVEKKTFKQVVVVAI